MTQNLCLTLAAFLLAQLIFPPSTSADVVINEIHYDPLDHVRNQEFIELYNSGEETIDLSNWRFSDGIDFTFPAGTSLAAGGYLVVALDPNDPLYPDSLGPWEGRLSGDGEHVALSDATNELIDEVDYRCEFPWPIAAGGDGASMELIHPGLDNDLGSSWRPSLNDLPTPAAVNSVFSETPPPNIRQVSHLPKAPTSSEEVTISVKLTDPDGMGEVKLHYKISPPGDYIPAYRPWTLQQLLQDPNRPRSQFSEYAEGIFTGFWPTLPMTPVDPEGTDADPDNDDFYTVTLPAQINRSLVRYYITAKDALGAEVRGPLKDDPSLNFAYFVYDGLPEYASANGTFSVDTLTTLPVYHLITRNEDWNQCLAYSGADQMPRNAMDARRASNWSGTIVYGDEVYDNISYRLRGGNGRYYLTGKRSMKFTFNRGRFFTVHDNRGKEYETTWRVLETSKMFGNRTSGTFGTRNVPGNFGLVDTINGQLWELFGIPAVRCHWFHFRVIDGEDEAPDPYAGDFYGLNLAMERIDSRFLESRNLPNGNLYKLTDTINDGKDQQRYQAPDAPVNAEDYLNIKTQLNSSKDEAWLRQYVNWDLWYRYTAVEEAIRHYDYWVGADKNMAFYFEPQEGNPLGLLWQLPYDSDATWGPSWNEGIDLPQAAVANKPVFQLELRNTIREFRDLLWQPEPIGHLIDDAAAIIDDFHPADYARWRNAPASEGREDFGTLESKVADMKLFAFQGNLQYPGGNVGPGGRAAFLDNMSNDSGIPKTPAISYSGPENHSLDQLSFETTPFASGSIFTPSTYSRTEWRIGEITDPEAPAYDPEERRHYEITAAWLATNEAGSTEETAKTAPANVLKIGRTYRARVRHWDTEGRSSHWSAPYQFTTTAPAIAGTLQQDLMITEIMFHPASITAEEQLAGYEETDFEFIELYNRGTGPLSLATVRFTKGIDFDFLDDALLQPGAYGLIVANVEAFETRYGGGLPIFGAWENNMALSNAGEDLKLSFGAGNPIHEFTYSDSSPWPDAADGDGHSLTVNGTTVNTDGYADPINWIASLEIGGSPGRADAPQASTGFTDWMSEQGLTDPLADPDGDGISAMMIYAMGLDLLPSAADLSQHLPTFGHETIEGTPGTEPVLQFRLRENSEGVRSTIERSEDLEVWAEETGDSSHLVLHDRHSNGDGSETVHYRFRETASRSEPAYFRLKFTTS